MVALNGFPLVSQLTNVSWDGSSPNQQFDCVPACLCAGAMYLHGIKQVDTQWNPDKFLDAAYPEGYKGGTDAANYVKFCASLDVHLFSVNGDATQQVQEIHNYLAKSSPVVMTILDPYVPANYGWTHAVVAFADSTGEITVLDPYIAKAVTHSDAEWEGLIRGNVLWIMELAEMIIDLNTPGVANYFTLVNGDQWQCKQTGKIIHGAILAEYCRYGNAGLCGLTFLGLPLSNEQAIPNASPCVKQFFERGVLVYDPAPHKLDNPPGAGNVYTAHLYSGIGQDPAISTLQKQVANLQSQLTTQQQTPDPIAAIHAVQAAVAPFK